MGHKTIYTLKLPSMNVASATYTLVLFMALAPGLALISDHQSQCKFCHGWLVARVTIVCVAKIITT